MDNNNNNITSHLMSISATTTTTDLIDAKLEEHQLCASRQCPRCGHKLSKRDWVGLPAGVKFDPTDQELIEHLEAKVVEGESNKAHPLIDKFIPTLDGEDGICYTHPEKLPGVTRDGLSRHFFHRPSKAYTTGTRKRRKIQTECDLQGETRWHKTGKTRPVMVNGQQKGCKKILVLYTNFGKNRKPEKTNWVMHQYHLGQHEEEKEGELVVSKIFYQTQPRQCNWSSSADKAALSVSGPTNVVAGEGSGEASGSVSSKEAAAMAATSAHHSDEMMSLGGGSLSVAYSNALELHHQLKTDPYGFVSFSKGFDEAGIVGGGQRESIAEQIISSMSAATCDPSHQITTQHDQLHQQQQHLATAAFHISRPTNPISQIISPPPLHHASIILDDHSSFHVPRIILPHHNFQQQQQTQQQETQQQQQQHHKLGGRSASGLEDIIMGCTSSSTAELKESSIANPQEAEWLKYSNFWHDPDNPNHQS